VAGGVRDDVDQDVGLAAEVVADLAAVGRQFLPIGARAAVTSGAITTAM
jgi:hypothetical protein